MSAFFPDRPDEQPGQTYWNGLPTTAARGTVVVADSDFFPEYWARDLVGQRIAVVRVDLEGVSAGGGVQYLDDRDGSGWRKVTEGRGGPRWPHRNVVIQPHTFRAA